MNIIVKLGAGYGLQINGKKVEFLAVRCAPALKNGLGSILPCKFSIVYLGASVDTSGSIQSELNRRIGLAYADFKALARIWNHANLTREWKYRIYTACMHIDETSIRTSNSMAHKDAEEKARWLSCPMR